MLAPDGPDLSNATQPRAQGPNSTQPPPAFSRASSDIRLLDTVWHPEGSRFGVLSAADRALINPELARAIVNDLFSSCLVTTQRSDPAAVPTEKLPDSFLQCV